MSLKYIKINLKMTERQALNLIIRTKGNHKGKGLYDYNNKKLKIVEEIINNDNVFIISKNNNNVINNFSEFNSNDENQILFQLRKSLKTKNYEIINPVIKCTQLLKHSEYIKDLNNKIKNSNK